nr:DUF1513 domain-containing protein [Vibrio agarilyticus]
MLPFRVSGSTTDQNRFGDHQTSSGQQSYSANSVNKASLIGCVSRATQGYSAIGCDAAFHPVFEVPLAKRGHGIASSIQGHVAIFARRPGDYIQIFSALDGRAITMLTPSVDQTFYGHGDYSKDGRYLYVSGGTLATSEGVISVYDATNDYRKVAQWRGIGIGPHDLKVLPNGEIVVAVGGEHTIGRQVVNRDSMRPNLSYLSAFGEVLEQVELPNPLLSIRHLAFDENNRVYAALQNRADEITDAPLAFAHRRSETPRWLAASAPHWLRFDNYIGSIAVSQGRVVLTSPRGNCVGIWRAQDLKMEHIITLRDASGVAFLPHQMLVSSGSGKALNTNPLTMQKTTHNTGLYWDNHLASII